MPSFLFKFTNCVRQDDATRAAKICFTTTISIISQIIIYIMAMHHSFQCHRLLFDNELPATDPQIFPQSVLCSLIPVMNDQATCTWIRLCDASSLLLSVLHTTMVFTSLDIQSSGKHFACLVTISLTIFTMSAHSPT